MQQKCARAENQVSVLNGIKICEEENCVLQATENETSEHYKGLEEDYRKNCLEKHNAKFARHVKENDEVYNNAQQLMEQLKCQLQDKTHQVKLVEKERKQRKQKLRKIGAKKQAISNELAAILAVNSEETTKLEQIHNTSMTLAKDLNRLRIEKMDLQKLEKKMRDQICQMDSTYRQLSSEMEHEQREVSVLKERLSSYSNSFIHNKRLSESVDLDQSKLENFLNYEKETKQELLSEVNNKKKKIERIRTFSKSNIGKNFITSDVDGESMISEDSQLANFDFVDLTSERKYSLDIQNFKSAKLQT